MGAQLHSLDGHHHLAGSVRDDSLCKLHSSSCFRDLYHLFLVSARARLVNVIMCFGNLPSVIAARP